MKTGDTVRQKVPVITGTITQTVWDEEADQKKHLVEWPTEDGEHLFHRWFLESDLEAIEVPE